jgi:hypothetical protein
MLKKILGIFVFMLLIGIAFIPTIESINSNEVCTIGGWTQTQKILASDGGGDDRFGNSVEINGIDAIVGSYFDDISGQINAGSAYVFVYGGASWTQQQKLTASDYQAYDEFGWSVSIDGDYAIVGAPKDDGIGVERGAAYIFYRSGILWSEQQKLTPGDPEDGDYFGNSVSIDGDYAIVGAPGKSGDQGFSYVFKRTGTTWTQMTKIGATGSVKLGWSVSISLPCVIMGAYGTNSNTGAAHIYELDGSSWYGKGVLTASDGMTADIFGVSVAIDDDYAICGSPGHDLTAGGEGAAYIFEKPSTGWVSMTETQKITASDNKGGDGFGKSVSVDGKEIIVSSPEKDNSGSERGAAYIFYRSGSLWSEQQKLTPDDAEDGDYFGWGVSISNNTAISGAFAEDNTNGADAGSAYIFDYTNLLPSTPTIDGPIKGNLDTSYTYTFTSTDPDGDEVSYLIKWGDGDITGWTDFQASGPPGYTEDHSWDTEGEYIIQAKTKDINDAESDWTVIIVTIPRNRAVSYLWNQWLFERFPILQRMLSLIRVI